MVEIKGIDNTMIANNLEAYEPTHPGELLRDELEYRNVSQRELARSMGVSYSMVNEVVNGRRAMTPELALLCEAVLGISATMLTGLQKDYDLARAKRNKSFMARLKALPRIAAAF